MKEPQIISYVIPIPIIIKEIYYLYYGIAIYNVFNNGEINEDIYYSSYDNFRREYDSEEEVSSNIFKERCDAETFRYEKHEELTQ